MSNQSDRRTSESMESEVEDAILLPQKRKATEQLDDSVGEGEGKGKARVLEEVPIGDRFADFVGEQVVGKGEVNAAGDKDSESSRDSCEFGHCSDKYDPDHMELRSWQDDPCHFCNELGHIPALCPTFLQAVLPHSQAAYDRLLSDWSSSDSDDDRDAERVYEDHSF